MTRQTRLLVAACAFAGSAAPASASAAAAACVPLSIATSAPLTSHGPHFASWNIDSSRDRLFFDVDLGSPQLRSLMAYASAGHSHLRFGGTGNDALFYGDGLGSAACPTPVTGTRECLNKTLFDNVSALAAASGAALIFGVNIHPVTGKPSPPQGPWDPTNARELFTYARAHKVDVGYVEIGNEQNTIMSAADQAAALVALDALLADVYSGAPPGARPLLVGPDTHSIRDAGSPNSAVLAYLAAFAGGLGARLHAVTHHEYIEIDYKNVLNATFLDQSAQIAAQVVAAVRNASAGVEVWAGEIGPHNGGGGYGPNSTPTNCQDNRVCGRFGSAVWYADSLSAKAAAGYQQYCRQDAIGADYALVNATADAATGAWSFAPSADLYLLALWHRVVSGAEGARVNVLGVVPPPARTLRAYAYCVAGAANATLLLINLDASAGACVAAPAFAAAGEPLRQWSLTPGDGGVESADTLLNGELLVGEAPLEPATVDASAGIQLPPLSVTFVSVPLAAGALPACA